MNDSYNNYDDKNLSEKKPCFILPTSLNSELKSSVIEPKNLNNIINKNFNYLESNNISIKFGMDGGEINTLYKLVKGKCKYVICILMKDDKSSNSQLLKETLSGIDYNIISLKEILIEPENILICVFFNEFFENEIFSLRDIKLLKNKNDFILSEKLYLTNKDKKGIKVHCISKLDYLTDVEILKCFYCLIVNNSRMENNIIFSTIISAGIILKSYALKELIQQSYYSKDNHSIIVPLLEQEESYNYENFFYLIKKYETFHFNLYNMNYYDMIAAVPISSLLNIITIDNLLFNELDYYYKYIDINQTLDFHDYNLSLYLYKKNYRIKYFNHETMGEIHYTDYNYYNPLLDYKVYKDIWIKRFSGYYGNFFEILRTFIDCNNFNLIKKIFMFFQIIGLFVEFIFPSLSTLVIYTIFYEAFGIYDIRPAAFCALLYLFMLICSGACSLITKNSEKTQLTDLIFYFFMEIYYLFILICSIIAIDNIRTNKINDSYKFNKLAITFIIILTFIIGILPMLIKITSIFDNIIPMLLYLVMGASPTSSSFYMAKILNSCDTCGVNNIKQRKGIVIIIYCLINLFFGSLIFFNYNRTRRIKTIMGLAIFYLIYLFFKILAIVINLLFNKKQSLNNENINNEIKNEFNLKNYYLKNSSYNPYKLDKLDSSRNGYQSTTLNFKVN